MWVQLKVHKVMDLKPYKRSPNQRGEEKVE
jgi:hypothetical protein